MTVLFSDVYIKLVQLNSHSLYWVYTFSKFYVSWNDYQLLSDDTPRSPQTRLHSLTEYLRDFQTELAISISQIIKQSRNCIISLTKPGHLSRFWNHELDYWICSGFDLMWWWQWTFRFHKSSSNSCVVPVDYWRNNLHLKVI
jgi:hypothetical protein